MYVFSPPFHSNLGSGRSPRGQGLAQCDKAYSASASLLHPVLPGIPASPGCPRSFAPVGSRQRKLFRGESKVNTSNNEIQSFKHMYSPNTCSFLSSNPGWGTDGGKISLKLTKAHEKRCRDGAGTSGREVPVPGLSHLRSVSTEGTPGPPPIHLAQARLWTHWPFHLFPPQQQTALGAAGSSEFL